MSQNKVIIVDQKPIAIMQSNGEDYISLTDMIKSFGSDSLIYNWMRNRNTIEFLGTWEQLYNPDFNFIEFDNVKRNAGLNSFILSPKKWIESTAANRRRMAKTKSRQIRQSARRGNPGAIGRTDKPGKHKRSFPSTGIITIRTTEKTERNRHFTNTIAHFQ
jgi:hypothetical protein